jgi:hypothetical protein
MPEGRRQIPTADVGHESACRDDEVDGQRECHPGEHDCKDRDLQDRRKGRGEPCIGLAGHRGVALLPQPARLRPEGEEREREEDHGERRGIAEVVARAHDGKEDLDRKHLVAAAEHQRVPEVGEAFDEGEEEGGGEAGAEERPRHRAEGLRGPGAQRLRGFLERGVDRLERREEDEEGDRREGQHLCDQDAGQAVDPARGSHAHEVRDPAGDEAGAAEEDDDGHSHHKGRRDDGQDRDGAERALHLEVGPVHEERKGEAQRSGEGGRQDAKHDRVHHDPAAPPAREAADPPEVGRREPRPEGAEREVAIGIDEGREAQLHDRKEDEKREERHDGRHAEGGEAFAPAEAPRRDEIGQEPDKRDASEVAAPAEAGLPFGGTGEDLGDPGS